MKLRGHKALDVGQPLYAKRGAITVSGREFALGALFPWRDLGLTERQLKRLHEQRRIGHELPHERNGAESVRVAAKITPPPVKPAKQSRAAR